MLPHELHSLPKTVGSPAFCRAKPVANRGIYIKYRNPKRYRLAYVSGYYWKPNDLHRFMQIPYPAKSRHQRLVCPGVLPVESSGRQAPEIG